MSRFMFYDDKESYLKAINDLLKDCDLHILNNILTMLYKHFWPGCV